MRCLRLSENQRNWTFDIIFWTHCKYLQSNGSGSALENLPFGWKYSSLTAILLQVLHCTSCEQKLLLLQVFQCFCLCRKLTQILQGKAVHFTSKHTLFLLRRETILLATIIGRMDNFMIVIWWQGEKLAGWEILTSWKVVKITGFTCIFSSKRFAVMTLQSS